MLRHSLQVPVNSKSDFIITYHFRAKFQQFCTRTFITAQHSAEMCIVPTTSGTPNGSSGLFGSSWIIFQKLFRITSFSQAILIRVAGTWCSTRCQFPAYSVRAAESFSQIAGLFIRTLHCWAERFGAFVIQEVFSADICPGRPYLRKDFRGCLWTLACVTLWFVRRHADTISSRSDRRVSNECTTVSAALFWYLEWT